MKKRPVLTKGQLIQRVARRADETKNPRLKMKLLKLLWELKKGT